MIKCIVQDLIKYLNKIKRAHELIERTNGEYLILINNNVCIK